RRRGQRRAAADVPEWSRRSVAERVAALEWAAVGDGLDDAGLAPAGPLLSLAESRSVAALYDEPERFRSTVDMAAHRFGEGEYRYFGHPLPDLVAELRAAFWPHLLPIARAWAERRNQPSPWPDDLVEWLARCHAMGQTRPTPLILRYEAGGWNALHRDLYGDLVFPLQVVIGLDRPDEDYTGGEFVVVEQRPRAQSRATASTIAQGHALVFTTRDRPVAGSRGWSSAPMRHGVSTVRSGVRRTLGLIFHDAR
ncbi:MAG: proline hydroxylase, partial [Ilumatobacteraceae bacterium]|nr:proline hydroxylase [Ilumatobacteraceae bacterium]